MRPMAKRRSREVFSGAVAGTDAASVFVEGGVEDMVSGFHTPVSPIESEEALRAGGVGAMAGDAVGVLDAAFTSWRARGTVYCHKVAVAQRQQKIVAT